MRTRPLGCCICVLVVRLPVPPGGGGGNTQQARGPFSTLQRFDKVWIKVER